MADASTVGTIYDLGYQHYEGTRLGRANAIKTLAAYSLRSALGIGRGERAKLVPVLIGLLCFAPAIVQIGMANADGDVSRISYAQQVQFTNFFLMLFAAAQAPELIVGDKQLGVVSLYLSRALRGTDYALAKLAALFAAVLLYSLLPQAAMYTGSLFVGSGPGHQLATTWHTIGAILGASVVASLYLASVALALSSLAARKGYASAAVIGFFLMLPVLALMSLAILTPHAARYSILGNPLQTLNGFARWVFGVHTRPRNVLSVTIPAFGAAYLYTLLGTAAAAVALLMHRYRRADV